MGSQSRCMPGSCRSKAWLTYRILFEKGVAVAASAVCINPLSRSTGSAREQGYPSLALYIRMLAKPKQPDLAECSHNSNLQVFQPMLGIY